MLIDFSFENYKSFKEEQAFSMRRNTSLDLEKDSILVDGLPKEGLSRVAAIYGANASGKSNFLSALLAVRDFVVKKTPPENFIENPKETSFYLSFLAKNKKKYNYIVTIENKIVSYEQLLIYNSIQPTTIFEYNKKEPNGEIFNSQIFGKEERTALKYNFTKNPARPILSFLKDSNSQDAKSAYIFFDKELVYRAELLESSKANNEITVNKATQDEEKFEFLNRIISVLDMGIDSVEMIDEDTALNEKQYGIFTDMMVKIFEAGDEKPDKKMLEKLKNEPFNAKIKKAVFKHIFDGKLASLNLDQESDGTLTGASLILDLLPILKNGSIYVVDELDKSLHPLITSQIIDVFNNKETNPNGAQLIFTTHDVSLLDSSIYGENILDRDEIWFTEKQFDGTSNLYPLSSVKYTTKKDDNFYKKYIEGRYGATPKISLSYVIRNYWEELK
ncbi:ATP-binding protein [Candidatus Saccharibacteria bacterium]|nr:ATP-binding protein [Candidatus Saccharibacteria bacterium]